MRSQKGDRDFAAGADLAFEAFADFAQREVRAEMIAQSGQAQAGGVQARCAVAAVVVVVGDVFQSCCFEAGEFHLPQTVALGRCGLLVYKSYSVRVRRGLYKISALLGRFAVSKGNGYLIWRRLVRHSS